MIWGGEKIAAYKGIETDKKNIGESWEISGYRDHQTCVAGGSFSGIALNDLLPFFGEEILGDRLYARFGNEFPLLIKFIHAREDLSIQVHPDDNMAGRHNRGTGKTEMWYVIDGEPGASLYCGFKESVSKEEYERLVTEGRITDVLACHKVRKGDVFFIPAGRVHAICSGCLLAEIQQNSDNTFRIYDYGRPGLDGKPRELHTELAKEAIDFSVLPEYRTIYEKVPDKENILVSCPFFTTSLYCLDAPVKRDISALDSFVILICTNGAAEIVTDEGRVSVDQGETVLVSCSSRSLEIIPQGDAAPVEILASYIE